MNRTGKETVRMARTEYLVIVEKYEGGAYGAYVPELPGIGVAGGGGA